MAERRMFAKTIIDSDAFLDMPLSSQSLYFHLSMRADDDGFINNPKKIQRMIGCADDDLKILIAKNFIIPFESGIVVIKHWKIHNYIRTDRYKETVYQEEMSMLEVKENKAYAFGIPNGYQMETQVRLGKDSIGKVSINNSPHHPTVEEVRTYCEERKNNIDAESFVDFYTANGWVQGKGKPIKDWKAAVRTWERNNRSNSDSPKNANKGMLRADYGSIDDLEKELLSN